MKTMYAAFSFQLLEFARKSRPEHTTNGSYGRLFSFLSSTSHPVTAFNVSLAQSLRMIAVTWKILQGDLLSPNQSQNAR